MLARGGFSLTSASWRQKDVMRPRTPMREIGFGSHGESRTHWSALVGIADWHTSYKVPGASVSGCVQASSIQHRVHASPSRLSVVSIALVSTWPSASIALCYPSLHAFLSHFGRMRMRPLPIISSINIDLQRNEARCETLDEFVLGPAGVLNPERVWKCLEQPG